MRVRIRSWLFEDLSYLMAVALIYFLTAQLGFLFSISPGNVTVVWLPSGVAAASVFMLGPRAGLGVWLGSFLANLWQMRSNGNPLHLTFTISSAIALGSTVQILVAVYMLRRWLASTAELLLRANPLKFAGLMALASLLAATVGVTTLLWSGQISAAEYMFTWGTWWVGDWLGIIIGMPVLTAVAMTIRRKTWPEVAPIMVLGLGLGFSLFLFIISWRQETRSINTEFRVDAAAAQVEIEQLMEESLQDISAVASLFNASPAVSRNGFDVFTQPYLKEEHLVHGLQALGWSPYLIGSERSAFEAGLRAEGFLDFHIMALDASGQLTPEAEQSEYVVLKYLEPLDTNRLVLGFNVLSDAQRRQALLLARDTGEPAMTGPLRLVQDADKQSGVLIFQPVYRGGHVPDSIETRRTELLGFVSIALRVDQLVEAAIAALPVAGRDIYIFDMNEPVGRQLLYFHSARLRTEPVTARATLSPQDIEGDALYMSEFEWAGRRWLMIVQPATGVMAAKRTLAPWAASVVSILVTLLATTYLYNRQQTEAVLRDNEANLRQIMSTALDAVITMNAHGVITSWNPAAEKIFGWSQVEAVGRKVGDLIVPPAMNAAHEQGLRHYLATGEGPYLDRHFEITAQHQNGGTFPVEMSLHALTVKGATSFTSFIRDITERKQAEFQLTSLAERLNLATHASQIGIWDWDVQKNKLVWDEQMYALYGLKPGEFAGAYDAWLHGVHPDDRAPSNEASARAQRGESEYDTEFRVVWPDGTINWLKANGQVFRDAQGTPLRMVGVNYDITRRKQAEEKLQELNQSLERRVQEATAEIRDLYDNAPAGYQNLDAEGRLLFVNETELTWLGRAREDVIGHSFTEFILPHQIGQFHTQHFPAVTSGQPVHDLEYDLVRPDGTTIPVMLNAIPVMDTAGRLVRTRATLVDITERKKAERALRENLKHVNAMYSISQASIAATDLQNLLDLVAQTMGEALAVDRVNIMYMDIANQRIELTSRSGPGIAEVADISFAEAWEGLTGWALREQKVAWSPRNVPDDRESPAVQQRRRDTHAGDIIVVPLIYQNFALGTITIINKPGDRDFNTEDMNMAQAIANQVAMAIEHIRAEIKLRMTNRELERAMRVKDEFLASMSHELRTPLNGILGLTESLQLETYGPLTSRQIKPVQTIGTSGQHLLQLINDLLDLSKIEAGKFDVFPEVINVEAICQASLNFVNEMARKKHIQLDFQPDPQAKNIIADPRRLKQILVNLLSNAIKFTPVKGQVTLKLKADPENQQLHFSVIDNGIGIAQADLERLFTPFTQIDSSLNRQYEGSGLGLALVLRLAEMQGGAVSVESEVRRGSRFTVSLPWESQSQLDEKQLTANVNEVSGPTTANSRGLILLAEDNEHNAQATVDYLEFQGYTLLVASNGHEAIDLAREHSPQVILMDIQMPIMDGLEAIRRLRADSRFRSTPIIALTALAMSGDRERCLAVGATEYMSKPVKLKELAVMVEELLKWST